MKTLNMHNADMKATFQSSKEARTGVACDVCNDELYYTDLNVMLTSYPPQMTVSCRNEGCKDYNKRKYKVV